MKQQITNKSVQELPKTEVKVPKLDIKNRRPSALSLTSIHRKKEIEETEVEFEEVEGLPTDDFSQEKLENLWKNYIDQLVKKGKRSVASILRANLPKKEGFEIHFALPNEQMKSQLDRSLNPLLRYLKEGLNSYKISIVIDVNEEETKKYAYTPKEQYEKLKEKNSAIELFKKTFDLDL